MNRQQFTTFWVDLGSNQRALIINGVGIIGAVVTLSLVKALMPEVDFSVLTGVVAMAVSAFVTSLIKQQFLI